MWRPEFSDPRLAAVYDAERVWGWEDDFYLAVLAERNAPRVLDLGCGTGRLAIALAAAGHEVTAVEPAAAALELARRKPGAERVTWVQGAGEGLPSRAYEVVLLTEHAAQFVLGDDEWSALLSGARRALVPGGRLILDAGDPEHPRWSRWDAAESRRAIVLPDGSLVRAWAEAEPVTENLMTLTNHFAITESEVVTSSTTVRLRSESELRRTVENAGFDVDRIYGGWAREPAGLGSDGELIVLAVARPQRTA